MQLPMLVEGSDLVILHTEWNDFKSINIVKIYHPHVLTVILLSYTPIKIKSQGFQYFGIGR